MIYMGTCNLKIPCFDCDSEICGNAGRKESDCPKSVCDNPNGYDCDDCEFIDIYIEIMRKLANGD